VDAPLGDFVHIRDTPFYMIHEQIQDRAHTGYNANARF